jgi:dihydrolipoamide dehydrogenase
MEIYDCIVIGAGPGGYVAALRGADLGGKICLVEKDKIGGTCMHRGCIPTKTLIASCKACRQIENAKRFGIAVDGDVRIDFNDVMRRKAKVVQILTKGVEKLIKDRGITLMHGEGRVAAPDLVTVGTPEGAVHELRTKSVIVATGSVPASLPDVTIDGRYILSSDHILEIDRIPSSILIVGAGAVGCEFAYILRVLGAEVSVLELLSRPLPFADHEISALMTTQLRKNRIQFHAGQRVAGIERKERGPLDVKSRNRNGEQLTLTVEKVLVSVGRRMEGGATGLEELGVSIMKNGAVAVNEKQETTIPGIFAIGDVTGGTMLAHAASHQGIVAVTNALGGDSSMRETHIPWVVYTHPEAAGVGLNEEDARKKGIEIKIGRFPYRVLGKAQSENQLDGMFKIISRTVDDRIIGAHILGEGADILIHEIAVALKLHGTTKELADVVHAHPTFSEGIMEAAMDTDEMALHIPRRSGHIS